MSIENVNQFYQVVLQDSALQQRFQFAPDEESLVKMAVELGQQHGYDFTAEEVIQAIALAQPPAETTGMVELADEQLEAVAGGKMHGGVGENVGEMIGKGLGYIAGGVAGITVGGVYAAVTNSDYGQTIKASSEIGAGILGGTLGAVGSLADH